MDIIERDIYALIVSGDGIKAREIAKKLNKDRSTVNHYLYNSPYMKDLCYRDENYEWYGLIRQSRPHVGLGDYSGYYGTVAEFLELTEDEWFQMLTEEDLYQYAELAGTTAEIPICSGDMLFNIFDEYLGFLEG